MASIMSCSLVTGGRSGGGSGPDRATTAYIAATGTWNLRFSTPSSLAITSSISS